jgi:hypothetical protein
MAEQPAAEPSEARAPRLERSAESRLVAGVCGGLGPRSCC